MVRARTIREAAVYFQEKDPQTCLTETAIRTLLRTGAVPCARVGRKYLVTIEALEAYLGGHVGAEKLWRLGLGSGRSSDPNTFYRR